MNRLDLNGVAKPRRVSRKPVAAPSKPDHLHGYAMAGVVLMAMLSALLNGYANAKHATIAWAGWGMGLVIPAIILILGKVASLIYKRRQKRTACITGGVGVGLLFLSVWHCATQHRGPDRFPPAAGPADGGRH